MKQNELKRKLEDQLEKEQEKRRRLENEVETLKKANKTLTKQGPSTRTYGKAIAMASELKSTLEICGEQHFKAHSIEVENIDTNKREILDLDTSVYIPKPIDKDRLHTITLIKDKFTISNAAYHELSLTSNLPKSNHNH